MHEQLRHAERQQLGRRGAAQPLAVRVVAEQLARDAAAQLEADRLGEVDHARLRDGVGHAQILRGRPEREVPAGRVADRHHGPPEQGLSL